MAISSTNMQTGVKTAVSLPITPSHQEPKTPPDQMLTPTPVEQLLERGLLIQVTQPDLHKRVARAWNINKSSNPFIEQYEGRYFISLASIDNQAQQRELYHLIHRFQIGAQIDVTELPPLLRKIIQPQLIPRERFIGAVALGLIPALATAVLLMTLAILLSTLLPRLDPVTNFRLIAYTFAVAFAFGWLLSTVIIWYELSKAAHSPI